MRAEKPLKDIFCEEEGRWEGGKVGRWEGGEVSFLLKGSKSYLGIIVPVLGKYENN